MGLSLIMAAIDVSDDLNVVLDEHYRSFRDRVFRWCMQYGGGRTAWAQDVTQDVFVRLLNHLPHLTDRDDLGGWLYRVTANLCKTRLKKEQSWLRRLGGFVVDQPESLGRDFEVQSEAAAALAVVRALPARERVAFCMKVLDGRTQREIAEDLGVSEALVCRWMRRYWKQIRAAGWEADDEQA